MSKLQDAPVVDGVCNICGTVDPVLKAIDDELGCFAEQIPYPDGMAMRQRTPIPVEWCFNPECPSNDIQHAYRALHAFHHDRIAEHLIIKHASPMALAKVLKQMLGEEERSLRDVLNEDLRHGFPRT